jgi:hypothetical protein
VAINNTFHLEMGTPPVVIGIIFLATGISWIKRL